MFLESNEKADKLGGEGCVCRWRKYRRGQGGNCQATANRGVRGDAVCLLRAVMRRSEIGMTEMRALQRRWSNDKVSEIKEARGSTERRSVIITAQHVRCGKASMNTSQEHVEVVSGWDRSSTTS